MKEIKVSILCTAYNHEKYIRDTLEGFVNQKTNFNYEVLINEDCSTDNTASIIKEYEKKYPNIIKPIYQKENQYSKKNVNILDDILFPKAKGKYIALCEGDDFWIDEKKLQMQVDYMESHTGCTFCFTNAIVHNNITGEDLEFYPEWVQIKTSKLTKKDKFLFTDILKIPFAPTASFMFPKNNYENFPKEFYEFCAGGDKKLLLFSNLLGYSHYINKKTCIYNVGVSNSATSKWAKANAEQLYNINLSFDTLFKNIDKITQYKFSKQIFNAAKPTRITMLLTGYNKQLLKQSEFKKTYKRTNIKTRIKIFLTYKNPKLLQFLMGIRYKKSK